MSDAEKKITPEVRKLGDLVQSTVMVAVHCEYCGEVHEDNVDELDQAAKDDIGQEIWDLGWRSHKDEESGLDVVMCPECAQNMEEGE